MRNLSTVTIKHYDNTVLTIYKFIETGTSIKDITIDVVNNFIIFCKNRLSIKDVSLDTYLRWLRVVLYYFMKLCYMNKI